MELMNRILGMTQLARTRTFLKFGTVGASGVIVNNGILWLLTQAGMAAVFASIIATETAIITNFIGNSFWTWGDHTQGSWRKRFLLFQGICLLSGALTVVLFLAFNTYLGLPLLVANTLAILIVFIINYALNSTITWNARTKTIEPAPTNLKKRANKTGQASSIRRHSDGAVRNGALRIIIFAIFAVMLAQATTALVSVSQMGYHPAGFKTVTVYTSETEGEFSVVDANGVRWKNGTLSRPTDFNGDPVNCQGNNSCLTGDFSDVVEQGLFHITTTIDGSSSEFPISESIYRDNATLFNEFYDAMRQQNSSYHADMNSGTDPAFPMMADGSFIMTADQASRTLIRLSDAYRRNPDLFASDNRTLETIRSYADYLASLQDANIQEHTDGTGFRLSTAMEVQNAFVPGPTDRPSLTVYIKKNETTYEVLKTVPVISLCGSLNGTAYDTCIADAALYYKCQEDEPCLNITYNGKTGTRLPGRKLNYSVPNGWTYEFGCFQDVDLRNGNFNTAPNPCMVYDRAETREQTVNALLAYTEAITPIYQYDTAKARELLDRAVQTRRYVIAAYPSFTAVDDDTGAWGAANLLLYDLTGDPNYLEIAYGVRDIVSTTFISDGVRGNEFYWQEYVRHKDVLSNNSYTYLMHGKDPETYFSDQMYGDYYLGGDVTRISKNGERVYQFDPDIQFMNSRYILTEGLLAAKTRDISSDNASFINTIADAQLAWMTGNNGVENGMSLNTSIMSISFIFGIGHYPAEYHSRLLMSSGYSQASGGAVVGMRGTGYQFYNGSDYIYLDGKTTILNNTLGGQGNGYRNETKALVFDPNQTFDNGLSYIPGWINGAFDINTDKDDIFNYEDSRDTFEFTETTNDLVATAVSLFAYRDAQYNGVPALPVPFLGTSGGSAHLSITSSPLGADVWFDTVYKGMTGPLDNVSFDTPAGLHTLELNLTGCTNYTNTFDIAPGEDIPLNITLNCSAPTNGTNSTNDTNATYTIFSVPPGANISIDLVPTGTTSLTIDLAPGEHNISLFLEGYSPLNDTINVTTGINRTIVYLLYPLNDTNSTNNTNSTPPILLRLLDSSTNATMENGEYTAFETYNTTYTVQYNDTATVIQWFVDGAPVRAVQSDRDTMVWTYDILYTSNTRMANITAVGNGQVNATFIVKVKDYINPFWRDTFGAPDALLEVFTSNLARNFTNVTVELYDKRKGLHNVTLMYQDANESTDWKILLIDLAVGDTVIRSVTVYDGTANYTATYPVLQLRAHYRAPEPKSNEGGSGGGGGGGLPPDDTGPELVYVILSKDIIKEGESVDITLDAKSARNIASVKGVFEDESGLATTVPLSMVGGTKTYGTWTALLSGDMPGQHTLTTIILTDSSNRTTTATITGRSYYVLGERVAATEHLSVVYTLLNTNTIDPGNNLTVKLDARDAKGIKTATAVLKDVQEKQPDIILPLALVTGTSQYGTWEGNVTLSAPDTTYMLYSTILSNEKEEREVRVYNQKVYVNYVQPAPSLLTGMVTGLPFSEERVVDLIRKPTTPLFIGLIGMGIAMLIASTITLGKNE